MKLTSDFRRPTESNQPHAALIRHGVTLSHRDPAFPLLVNHYPRCSHVRWHLHQHDEIELCFAPHDSGAILYADREVRFRPGDVFLTGANTWHHPVFDSPTNRGLIVIYFHPSLLQHTPPEWAPLVDALANRATGWHQVRNEPAVHRLMFETLRLFQSNQPHWQIVCQGILLHLLSYFARDVVAQALPAAAVPNAINTAAFAKVTDHIRNHLAEVIPAAKLYRLAGMSRTQFCRQFKACFGVPVGAYVRQLRLLKARSLLHHSTLSITEISLESGFNSVSFFNRVFKQAEGVSPSQFRRRCSAT